MFTIHFMIVENIILVKGKTQLKKMFESTTSFIILKSKILTLCQESGSLFLHLLYVCNNKKKVRKKTLTRGAYREFIELVIELVLEKHNSELRS